ncbi:Hypothetical Protein FCC1311_076022 [Hondaea fermentalgiana]|uniref:Uncharacterized protein n=1 Tax=Hondaea fermentalgiana TaxID=2315210 RepID=A0A2R5GNR2_9STRA|nr:Hypothetical Protein FCC1311_076022 [Hondaea fermentalgiana]|eukprot:GBG31378.1 Hypothetical Protein FCC1311_076022 [Hondaea fermentalgiana]
MRQIDDDTYVGRHGGKLHGLTKSDEAGSGQGPVDVNVRVKKGQFRWYDRLTTADQMYASGEYARAFHVYDDVIAMPGFPVKHRPAVLLSAARTLAAQHRDLEAGRLLEAAFEDKPSLATTEALRFTAGLLAARAADWSNARHLYLQVIAQNPHHMDALNHLAMLELIVGNLDAFQTRFLHFIRIQSAVAENRQHRLFQSVNHSYKSSFRKDRLGQEMTAWLTDHVMLSFSLDGAPSRLAAAALAGNADLEGYLPGSIEANCVLVYTAYTRTLISGTRFDAQGADLNRGLLHFNLAQRLRRVGALDEAAWHLQFAADLDARQRRGILLFQAALLQSRASSAFAARNERLAHFSTRLSALEELLQAPENGSSFHCMALSASLDLPVERALTEALKRAASAACDIDLAEGDEQLARVPTKDADRVRRIGVFSAEFCNSTSGRMLVPLLRAIGLQKARFNADLVLFTWPLLPSRRYLVNPEMLNNIDPFNAGLAAETIRSQRLDELIVVDAHRDLRVWLLANTRGIAPRVSHWNLASPRGALARMTPKVQTSFLFALFDDLWNWSSPPRPRHQSRISASIQGQYFFAEELYFLIAGRALDVDPDPGLEDFIETLHALHSSTVVIFIGGEADESVARTALWKRLAARKIDLSRVRVLRRLPRDVFLTFVEQNVDVVVDISAERNAFVQSLQARPQTDDTGTTCILNGYESTVSALL